MVKNDTAQIPVIDGLTTTSEIAKGMLGAVAITAVPMLLLGLCAGLIVLMVKTPMNRLAEAAR